MLNMRSRRRRRQRRRTRPDVVVVCCRWRHSRDACVLSLKQIKHIKICENPVWFVRFASDIHSHKASACARCMSDGWAVYFERVCVRVGIGVRTHDTWLPSPLPRTLTRIVQHGTRHIYVVHVQSDTYIVCMRRRRKTFVSANLSIRCYLPVINRIQENIIYE